MARMTKFAELGAACGRAALEKTAYYGQGGMNAWGQGPMGSEPHIDFAAQDRAVANVMKEREAQAVAQNAAQKTTQGGGSRLGSIFKSKWGRRGLIGAGLLGLGVAATSMMSNGAQQQMPGMAAPQPMGQQNVMPPMYEPQYDGQPEM